MDKKLSETVFFLRGLSADEEYRIINSRVVEDPEQHIASANRRHVQQTSGNVFYNSPRRLHDPVDLVPKALDKDGDNRLNALLSAMAFLRPFANFLLGMAARVEEKIAEVPAAAKALEVVEHFRDRAEAPFPSQRWKRLDAGVSPLFRNVFYLFDELLKLLHGDLVRRYKFSEDAWEDSAAQAKTRVKRLYPEFSPIVDIFHTKIRHQGDKGGAVRVEYRCALEIDGSAADVQEQLRQFDGKGDAERGRSAMIKHPHVLTLKLAGTGSARVPEEVAVGGRRYALDALVCAAEDGCFACVRDQGGLAQLGPCVTRLRNSGAALPCLAFYVAANYDFDS